MYRPTVSQRGHQRWPIAPHPGRVPVVFSPPGIQETINPFRDRDIDFGNRVNQFENAPDFLMEAWAPDAKCEPPRALRQTGYYKHLVTTKDGKVCWNPN